MPHVDISTYAGRDDETKKRVAEAVVETMMKELGCKVEHLSVAIHDVDPADWKETIQDKVDVSKVYAGGAFEEK